MNSSACEGSGEGCWSPSLILLVPVLLSVAWIVFKLLYGSWILAVLVTKVANLLLKDSGIYIGINVISGNVPTWYLEHILQVLSISACCLGE